MNIAFFGSSEFAVPSLIALKASGYEISCVVTQPDRKKGRGLSLTVTPVKGLAQKNEVKIYQPLSINTPEDIKFLKSLNADLFVVMAYGQILSPEVLNIPRILAINAHASLLPKYRGAAPINWALIKGEKKTGVTIMKMVEEMDAGPIILQEGVDIRDEDTAITLEDELSRIAAGLIIEAIRSIEDNNYKLIPQPKEDVSFAPKLKKEDGRINWNKSALEISNLIRGCVGWPGAFSFYKDKRLKIIKARISRLSLPVRQAGGHAVLRRNN